MALANAGRHADLEAAANELLSRTPRAGETWALLGLALWMQGKDALPALQRAAQLLPQDAEAQANLGTALRMRGRFEEARACYVQALALKPAYAEAHNNLGSVLRDLGRVAEAIDSFKRARDLQPGLAVVHCNLGMALRTLGRSRDAISCFGTAIGIDPNLFEAHKELGSAYQELGQFDAALNSFGRASKLNPGMASIQVSIGSVYLDLARHDEAWACLQSALAIEPASADAHCKLGAVMRLKGEALQARQCCQRALDSNPELPSAWHLLGMLQSDRGDFAAAELSFQRAIALDPNHADAWAAIPTLRKMTLDDSTWLREALRVAKGPLPPRREASLRYALGKYFDDVKDYEEAFGHYRRANDLPRLNGLVHDRHGVTKEIDRLTEFYGADWLSRQSARGDPSVRPVFIVGLPRSGTTLVEQILAAHPGVFGAGELSSWVGATTSFAAASMTDDAVAVRLDRLSRDYNRILDAQASEALRVVDKTPMNFKCLGLIHATFPRARIICMSRNPIDTCLSIYFQYFHGAHTYANDLLDLAHYFREYTRMMQHWRALLPHEVLMEVCYEDLTQEPELHSRRLIEFLELPWDARCLDFHQIGGSILTFSRWQARQRINTGSVERWRRYEKFVAPLLSLVDLSAAAHSRA